MEQECAPSRQNSRLQQRGARVKILITTVTCLIATAMVAFAHHSLNGEFDRTIEKECRATVVSFEWANPHASFQARVESSGGASTLYIFELPAPSGLDRIGWTRDTVRPNDTLVISAYPAKDKSARASVHRVTLSSGKTLEIDHPFANPPTP